jgi:hypothetical protein
MTATSTTLENIVSLREAVALSGISNVLPWRYELESSPDVKGPGKRVLTYPEFLTKLGEVFDTGNYYKDS